MGGPVRRVASIKYLGHRAGMVLALIAVGGFAAMADGGTGVSPSGVDAGAARLQLAQKTPGGDDLLTDEDDLLIDKEADKDDLLIDTEADKAEPPKAEAKPEPVERQAREAHAALFAESRFPSAGTCGTCHPKQYREWSVSQHSYSQLSPVYLSLNNRILELTNGSDGDFCLRCHSQVGANLGESPIISNLKRHPTSREGITCVVCHRQNKSYNKVSGRLALVEGDLTEPVFGPMGDAEMRRTLDNPNIYRMVTDPKSPLRKVHKKITLFEPISTPTFCGTCHDVTLFNGFRLEEAFSEYRMSPAAARGVTCQDCHMGKIQGKPSGYEHGPAAVVGGAPTKPRKLTNHFFGGPDYSVIHPGIFPHNIDAQRLATLEEWLRFDYKAGWGTDKFEDSVPGGRVFPKRWESADDRFDAREILDEQFKRLEWAHQKRLEVLRNGYHLTDVVVDRADPGGIVFRAKVENAQDGHNVPTGFTGERQVWLDVTVTDRDGKIVFRSGDADPNGDLRDEHSSFVHAHKLPFDEQLFTLQSKFQVQSGRGAELPQVIPIPYPFISLPRVLPAPVSLIFTGEPPTERNHKKGIEPLGHRWARYRVDGDALSGKGPYKAEILLRSQMVPVNLLIGIQSVGFDYNMSPREVADAVLAGGDVLWRKEITIRVGK